MGLNDNDAAQTVSGYSYSTVSIDELDAAEYTIVRIAMDKSYSVIDYKKDLEKALAGCLDSCKKSAREENLLVSVQSFNHELEEIHGFVPLADIEVSKYKNTIDPDGSTALWDATLSSVEAVKQYGENLEKMDFLCNGIVFIITDGEENSSVAANPKKIRDTIARVKKEEKLESLKIVLIGVGDEMETEKYLKSFVQDAGIDQFVWVGSATPAKLAKLASFVSKSISTVSMSLGNGGQSGSIEITF